jgi:hypothetical protein
MNQDLYAETTARIVAALERGTPPLVRPWSQVDEAIPVNAHTRRPYRGVNFTLLSLEAQTQGYSVNRWLTYPHAHELGGNVRKGERGTPVVFWQLRKVGVAAEAYPEPDDVPALPAKVYPLLVTKADIADVFLFDGTEGVIFPVAPNPDAWPRIHAAWDEFARYITDAQAPPLTDRDVRIRDDPEWLEAAARVRRTSYGVRRTQC